MQVQHGETLSVIVVNWNRKELLRACLASLLSQEGVQKEIIVVDNGSSDGSVQMLEQEFRSVKVIRNTVNLGFCAANNQGIAAASGEFIALLNNDAEACPNWLYELRRVFDSRPDVGMAASKVLVWEDPRRIDKAGHLIYLDGQNRGRGSGELDVGQYDTMEEILWPDGCAAMYRRGMLQQIGGFDEDFFAYADDAELGLRARIAGWRCFYTPAAVVRHHRGATLGVRSLRRVELIERNRILLAAKLFPWSLLWLNGAFYLARLLAGAWAALRGKGEISRFPGWGNKFRVALAMLKGDMEALRMLPKIPRKRRQVARIRKLTAAEIRRLLWNKRISLKTLSQESV
ncbi:MAG: glycosyltransferase [Bryobacterales bacterium]|nr:glycosyltransferase [Bryobacterales bacterium]